MRILINAITLDNANIVPLLIKIKAWEKNGARITFFGNEYFKNHAVAHEEINNHDFILLGNRFVRQKNQKNTKGRFHFIFECAKRNVIAFPYLKKFRGQYDLVYSLSGVLDLVLFPYLLKMVDRKVKWAVVFDNVVPLNDRGNKIIRFLAWIFFQISLQLVRKADLIFVPHPEVKRYLLMKGFSKNKLQDTSCAVENDLIMKAEKIEGYSPDALFVGRINETKGIYDMLFVLKRILARYPNFQLVIMGDGDENSKKKFGNEVRKMKLGNNIQFIGYKRGIEKYNIIKSAKCFWFLSVSPSESFGIALLEAVCSGIPAFAYELPQFSRIYLNGEVDISPKNDYESVAKKVVELFEKGIFENKKGEILIDKYSWEKIAETEYDAIKNL
jgi:glycosyltransferase involved in cell wall biosynthesis